MSESALLAELHAILNDPNYCAVKAIVDGERKRGFRVVRPGDAGWFRTNHWHPDSVASFDGHNCRLVLLRAHRPGKGAFTRTVRAIELAGHIPAVIEPTKEFAEMLTRRGWKGRQYGRSFETRETIWKPCA